MVKNLVDWGGGWFDGMKYTVEKKGEGRTQQLNPSIGGVQCFRSYAKKLTGN